MKAILFLLLISIPLSAQIKGIVVDESGKPISYVNIWVENKNLGTTSEEDGTFSLSANEGEKVVFSALGYEVKALPSKDVQTVVLHQKTIELDEVVLERRKGTSEIIVGDFSGIKLNSGVTNTGQDNVHVWGKFIASDEKIKTHPYVQSIEFVTRSHLKNVLLRIRVFKVNSEGVVVGDEVEEDILVSIKKGKNNNVVDLLKYNIKIPEVGIIFGFEYLKLEQNKYEQNYSLEGQKGVIKGYSYEPTIEGFAFGSETLVILNRDGTLRSATYGNVEIALKIKLSN